MTEPILLLVSMYISIIYGLLYGFFFSFPIVFGEGWGFNNGLVGLTFISVLIGTIGALLVTPALEKIYIRRTKARGHGLPEDRLVGMMLAAPFVPLCALNFFPIDNLLLTVRNSAFHIWLDFTTLRVYSGRKVDCTLYRRNPIRSRHGSRVCQCERISDRLFPIICGLRSCSEDGSTFWGGCSCSFVHW